MHGSVPQPLPCTPILHHKATLTTPCPKHIQYVLMRGLSGFRLLHFLLPELAVQLEICIASVHCNLCFHSRFSFVCALQLRCPTKSGVRARTMVQTQEMQWVTLFTPHQRDTHRDTNTSMSHGRVLIYLPGRSRNTAYYLTRHASRLTVGVWEYRRLITNFLSVAGLSLTIYGSCTDAERQHCDAVGKTLCTNIGPRERSACWMLSNVCGRSQQPDSFWQEHT